MTEKTIFYHVGLGKVASTYLQKSVFPAFKGIHYVHRNRFRQHPVIVPKLTATRILLSRENSQRLADETAKLAGYYPEAIPIIVLRRHDGWIASQFRRYVKNGGAATFEQFFDVEQDTGVWRQHELELRDKLDVLNKTFGRPPYVLFYDQLREDPFRVIDELATLVGATYDPADVPLNVRHRSYTDKQLQVLRHFRPRFLEIGPNESKKGVLGYLRFRLRLLATYLIMALARYVPDEGFASEPLIDPSALARIKDAYSKDWQACLDYAQQNNPGYARIDELEP